VEPVAIHLRQQSQPGRPCIFCQKAAEDKDAENFVLYRGPRTFALLNLYPYTTGHLMIAPYQHSATLTELPVETLAEIMSLAQSAERHLRALYKPQGLNVGINVGECAGAELQATSTCTCCRVGRRIRTS